MDGAIERALVTGLDLSALRADRKAMADAQAELAKLRKIEAAAELSCGLLWMTAEWRQGKTEDAYKALRDALGGSGSKGLGKAIQRAMDSGAKVDAPPGCYWPEP